MTFPDIKTCFQATRNQRSAALSLQASINNSAMQNPFLKPHTVPQWLLSSICWVGSCLGGFLGCSKMALALSSPPRNVLFPESITISLVVGCAVVVCVLMWRRVISVGWQIIGRPSSETLTVKLVENLGLVWLALIFAAFAISVLLIAFGLFMCLALAGEPQGGGWQ